MQTIHMEQRFAAPPEKVFAAVTDHRGMEKWLEGMRVTLEKEGDPPPNGLGAVRKIQARGTTVVEEVVRWEEPTAMDYKVIRGLIQDHLGEIRLYPENGGTLLDYRIRFRVPWWATGPILGSLVATLLKGELEKGLVRLAASLA